MEEKSVRKLQQENILNSAENLSLVRPELENRQEERLENSLRPQTLEEYIGQTREVSHLTIVYFMDHLGLEKQQ